jgi:CTP:molybdopterin cytidylyltransferase MocA
MISSKSMSRIVTESAEIPVPVYSGKVSDANPVWAAKKCPGRMTRLVSVPGQKSVGLPLRCTPVGRCAVWHFPM